MTMSPPPPDDLPLVAVIEDEVVIRQIVSRVGEKFGRYRTVEGATGFDAVAIAFGHPRPDAMLLNLTMPGMDGRDALAHHPRA